MILEFLNGLLGWITTIFAVASMFSMGLSFTVRQIIEPLRDLQITIMALVVNFVIIPAAAYLITLIFPLPSDSQIGLMLIAMAAGAPLVPKLAQIAKGDVPHAVSTVMLLVVVTVIYLPLVLPVLEPSALVDPLSIGLPLFVQLLLPLALGLIVRAATATAASAIRPVSGIVSNITLALLLLLTIVTRSSGLLGLVGTGAIVAVVLLIGIALTVGYVLGGPDTDSRRTLSLAAAQRNMAAAFVLAAGTFGARPGVLALVAGASLVAIVVVFSAAFIMGRSPAAVAT